MNFAATSKSFAAPSKSFAAPSKSFAAYTLAHLLMDARIDYNLLHDSLKLGIASFRNYLNRQVVLLEKCYLFGEQKEFHGRSLPTGSVKVERSPPERKVVSSSHNPSHTKDLKMAIDILS